MRICSLLLGLLPEIHQVRGLSGAGPIELPCLVDQANCGEVYYITWTKQTLLQNSTSSSPYHLTLPPVPSVAMSVQLQQQQQQQPWTRVYLYTGANDSSPHKPIGDLLNRANFLMPERSSPNDDDRLQLQQQQQLPLAKLVIEDPRLSDEALYKCDVTYVKGKCPSISLVRVQVMALPSKAQIVGQLTPVATSGGSSGPIADGTLIGPYSEHEQLKLACLVYGGRPQPKSVIWRKIDSSGRTINLQSTISGGQQQRNHQAGSNVVELNLNHTLTSADLGAKFECHVEHEAIEEPPARVVVSNGGGSGGGGGIMSGASDALLDLHPSGGPMVDLSNSRNSLETPPRSRSLDSHVFVDLNVGVASLDLFMAKVNRRNSSESMKEGDLVELECVAYNSKPPANITWFNGPDSIEQLDPTTAAGTGSDTAYASIQNNWHQQHKLRHKRLLQRNQVHQNNDGQTYNTHSFLSIKLSRHEHRAQISCKAQNNAMPKPVVKSLELQVEHAPIVLMEPAAGITVNESPPSNLGDLQQQQQQPQQPPSDESMAHVITTMSATQARQHQQPQTVSIYCIYSANPTELLPSSTRWFKDGQPLQLGATKASQQHEDESLVGALDSQEPGSGMDKHLTESLTPTGYPVLTIHGPGRRDAGLYECQLANSVGQSERLPASEACKLEVNFRPRVQLRLFRPTKQLRATGTSQQATIEMGDLMEIDLEQELLLAGSSLVLSCEVLEARPGKIHKFHWFKGPPRGRMGSSATQTVALLKRRSSALGENTANGDSSGKPQLMGVTESGQFVLQSLAANFTPQSFACTAFNSLGSSDRSEPMDIQLSYMPGPSQVRPVNDPTLRKTILASGKPTRSHSSVIDSSDSGGPQQQQPQPQHPLPAGRELLLECVTPDLGQPRANLWLWFKNGHPIESSSSPPMPLGNRFQQQQHPNGSNSNNPSSTIETEAAAGVLILNPRNDDNPIIGQQQLPGNLGGGANIRDGAGDSQPQQQEPPSPLKDGGASLATAREIYRPPQSSDHHRHHSTNVGLISSGRYLYIPSIQLVHKGNYSCVAVNRFGSSQKLQHQQQQSERDSYQVSVALAPSFVQPLASRTYWPETPMSTAAGEQSMTTTTTSIANGRQLELVCHIQCEPICQIEWLRNNDPLDFKRQSESLSSNYVTYQVKQTIFDENLEANLFKSVESRLVIQFLDNTPNGHHQRSSGSQQQYRDKILERRALLSGSNYTCQSGPNIMGPPVRSTTKFIVQYQPENVLINAPSDKLSLVEGSNGPSLSCEASGEPQVQYRWFLLKTGTDLAATAATTTRYNGHQKVDRGSISQSLPRTAATGQPEGGASARGPIDQVANKAFNGASLPGVNDVEGGIEQNLIELTGSATEQAGGAFSTLDLSNLSLDRKQTGRYICEASNRLGQARQSVYVNVLYKPTCATLHLHSLDLTMTPSLVDNSNNNFITKASTKQEVNQNRYRPYKATMNDEYSLVRETSEDFIDLRKVLVLSPLLNRYATLRNLDDEPSLRGSIFQAIMNNNDKRVQDGASSGSSSVIGNNKVDSQFKDTDALLHMDDKSDQLNKQQNLFVSIDNRGQSSDHLESVRSNSSTGDSWNKFNILLLKFLNSYMKQVKMFEENTMDAATKTTSSASNTRQNRRSNQEGPLDQSPGSFTEDNSENSNSDLNIGTSRDLLTFACMAQDANPTNDLTFDWSFGSTNLPETGGGAQLNIDNNGNNNNNLNNPNYLEQDNKATLPPLKPVLIYANENYTLHVMLVKRLDTKTSLNPFQMSLVTLNVVVEPLVVSGGYSMSNRIARQAKFSSNKTGNRSQIVRHRYQQSLLNSLKASSQSAGSNSNNNNNNNIQFAQDFETKPYNLGSPSIELNEQNWQEQLGNLLKCRVTNQIGTSDVCHVQINMAERLKGQSSSSEFAKWRLMPSLANKSLLIISIMVGCALIIFVTTALLLGPHLRELTSSSSSKKNDPMRRGEDNNTGQSTCSQKSSVLGLLGNGDSSIQGSSDDDSSARMNSLIDPTNKVGRMPQPRGMLDMDDMSISKAVANGYRHHHHHLLTQESSGNSYDEPRSLHESRLMYSSNHGQYHEAAGGDPGNCNGIASTNHHDSANNSKATQGSAGSRLLANLRFKSLSKFKVDRISDLSSFAGRLDQMRSAHHKSISNSETNTTGLSVPSLGGGEISIKMTSPTSTESPSFSATNHSSHHDDFKRQTVDKQQQHQQIYTLNHPSSQIFNPNGLQTSEQDTQAMQLSSRTLVNATFNNMLPAAYSNMVDYDAPSGPNELDEFIRQREVVDPAAIPDCQSDAAAFYRSQSVRNQTANQALYMFKNDLNHLYPQPINRGPPVYPRAHQSSTMYRSRLDDNRPAVVARSSHRHIIGAHTAAQPYPQINNRFSMPPYHHQTFDISEKPIPTMGYMDTIDSHLNRFTDNAANGLYLNQNTAYANALNSYTQDLYNNVVVSNQNQSVEHIYDVNAYATPEQTPHRGPMSMGQLQSSQSERLRVSQLIRTFNSKAPE